MILGMVTILVPFALADAPACDRPASAEDLGAAVSAAEDAWQARQFSASATALDRADAALRCLDTVAAPDVLAHYYRLRGLHLLLDKKPDAATPWLGAARGLAPTLTLTELVPNPSGPLSQSWDAARDLRQSTEPLPPPAEGAVYLDGTDTLARPTQVPTWFQRTDAEARVVDRAMVQPGDEVPAYPVKRTAPGKTLGARVLIYSGASLALASAAGWTMGGLKGQKYLDDVNGEIEYRTTPEEAVSLYRSEVLDPARKEANMWFGIGAGLLTLGAAGITVGFVLP